MEIVIRRDNESIESFQPLMIFCSEPWQSIPLQVFNMFCGEGCLRIAHWYFALMIYDPQLHWIDRKCRGAYRTEIFHCIYRIIKLKKLKGNCYTRSVIVIWVGFQWKTTQTTFIKAKIVCHFKNDVFNPQYASFGFPNKGMSNFFDYLPLLYSSALMLKAGIM